MSEVKVSEFKLKVGQSATTWIHASIGDQAVRTVTRIRVKSIDGDTVTLTAEQDAQEGTDEAL